MEQFMELLHQFEAAEQQYIRIHPDAQPLGNFYNAFGLKKLLEILKEADGRKITFKFNATLQKYEYSFA
ncbi:hypothetical protein [Rhodoflexus caldus]|uniref:hypothetical protein n=1 Tax=Rhodoflexus caldus TaxID=2891236 RepID=UPI00202A8C8E|nr:hypothetical protein [Rhodoflexus caldus]